METETVESSKAKPSRGEGLKSSQVVTFCIANQEYGIDIMKVQEIILMGEITQVPEVPVYIKGVINLRGNVIPIIDLRRRFNLAEEEVNEETRIIVVNVNKKTIGIVVDAVNEVLRTGHSEIEPPPSTIMGLGRDYLKGLIKLEKRLLILLDIDKILSLAELAQTQEHIQ